MKKEDVVLLVQLLDSMEAVLSKLDENYRKRNMEGLEKSKREILNIQKEIDRIL